ncbi:hypothetical protein ACWGQL_32920 [Streptomyces lydicus]
MFNFLRRARRSMLAEPMGVAVVDVTAFPDRHTERCANFAVVAQPLGPLVTEMIALHTHTRHLSWLSEREQCPDSYRLLARSIVREVLAGWHHQTDGRGTIGDLLTDDAHRARRGRVPEQRDARASGLPPLAAVRMLRVRCRRNRHPSSGGRKGRSRERLRPRRLHRQCRIPAPAREADLGASELAHSAPRQGAAPWWSHARGQQQ